MRQRYARLRNKKGILLLEVVMAVAILAVSLTMILRSFTNSTRMIESSGDYSTAIILAEEALWGLESVTADAWASGGKFKDFPGYSWSQDNRIMEDLALREVGLGIEWSRRNRNYKLRIAAFLPDEESK